MGSEIGCRNYSEGAFVKVNMKRGIPFDDIPVGSAFTHEGKMFIKTDAPGSGEFVSGEGVDLESGYVWKFEAHDECFIENVEVRDICLVQELNK